MIFVLIFVEEISCNVNNMTLKRGGYHCNGPCINNNTGYHNWSIAWDKCGEVETCTRIFRWENGSHYYYYLRKADDVFDDNTRFLHVDYNSKCRGRFYKKSLNLKNIL